MRKKRFAICGLSTRGVYHFVLPLIGKNWEGGTNFNDRAELVAILDLDKKRVETFERKVGINVPYFAANSFPKLLAETKPDVVIAVGPDYTHCDHVVGALEAGCDAIAEKPMVINCEQVRRVKAAEKKSGRSVKVAFNYRYQPTMKALKKLILDGKLGRIINVEFIYNLDTWHGSSYFYRWNRDRARSGGLSIHKGCHHFDLLNWLIADAPAEVCAFGGLNYYGPKGALRPRGAKGKPLSPVEEKKNCPVFKKHYASKLDPASNDIRTGWDQFGLPLDAQYPPDKRRYIYDDEIQIEDTYNAIIRYRNGVSVSYSCNFCTPWEGYILAINGTGGRAEVSDHTDPDPTGKSLAHGTQPITYYPLFGGKKLIQVQTVAGGHGGADFKIQEDLLDGPSAESRKLDITAGSEAGGYAVAIGEAVWRSIKERRSISIPHLLAGKF